MKLRPLCDVSGKRRYDTEGEANESRRQIARRKRGRVPRKVYECPHCHGWHLTGRAGRRR